MQITVQNELTSELSEFLKKFWHDADIEHYGKDSGWQSESLIFLAYEEEIKDPVGVLYAKLDAGVIFLDAIIVSKNSQKKGIGTALMSELEKVAKEKNAHKIYLYTRDDWNAVKLYKKFGFKKTQNLPNHYLKKDWVEYTKFL